MFYLRSVSFAQGRAEPSLPFPYSVRHSIVFCVAVKKTNKTQNGVLGNCWAAVETIMNQWNERKTQSGFSFFGLYKAAASPWKRCVKTSRSPQHTYTERKNERKLTFNCTCSSFLLVPLEKHIRQHFTCQINMLQMIQYKDENIDRTLYWLKPAITHKS